MKSLRLLLLFPLLAVVPTSACKQSGATVIVPSLERPGPLTFACFSEADSAFTMQLSDCDGVTGLSAETHRIYSFALESTRGEISVIDWTAVRAVDSDRRVPGFTFYRVGEAPSAILIPENDSRMLFVANYGSFSVQSIETASLVPDAVQDDADVLHPSTVTLPSGPTDLEYLSVGGATWLFAALPDAGSIAQIPVNADGSLGAPTYLATSTALPAQVPASTEPDYVRVCPLPPDSYVRAATVAPRTPRSLGAASRPNRLALIERAGGVIEVVSADAALPVVHRFTTSAAGLTEIPGFAVAVPTLDVVATPLVPATYQAFGATDVATEQYVYAIDAIDRSILVVDVTTGAVLPINIGDRAADRVAYESGALTLEVATPGYVLADDPFSNRCDPTSGERRNAIGATALRGVFVTASLTDGTFGFIDVYDLDASCRGPAACGGAGVGNDTLVYEHRHRPRLQSFVVQAPALVNTLFRYAGGAGGLSGSGASSSGIGPGLLPIDDANASEKLCPGTSTVSGRGQMVSGFTSTGDAATEGEPLICLLDDPVSIRAQNVAATWEGLIPTAQGVRGALVDVAGTPTFQTEDGDFCAWGVLGGDDVAAAGLSTMDPESGYGGDLLVITANVPFELRGEAACKDLLLPTSGTSTRIRVGFAIKQAFGDHLLLGDFVPDGNYTLFSELNASPSTAFAKVLACFPGLVSYEVRAHSAYVVASSISLPRHRVLEGAGTACTIDTAGQPFDPAEPDTARSFRALPDRNFIHPQFAFRISDYQDLKSGMAAQLTFSVTYVTPHLRQDSGFLGVALHYNAVDERFYAVDEPTHGILQYDLDPIAALHRVQ